VSQFKKYVPHLIELRKRALFCLSAFFVVLCVLLFFSSKLYTLLAQPILDILPAPSMLIATKVLTPFTAPLKLSFFASLVIIVPLILYQLWAFVAPGLYRKEKRAIAPLFLISTLLFYVGMAFAHFVVCPLTLRFLLFMAPEGVQLMTDFADYLDFILMLYWVFGLAFQVPVFTFVLLWTGIISLDTIKRTRPYVIVGAFVIGMLLTPPDVVSQICLAIPLWFLFEAGVFWAKLFLKPLKQLKVKENA
jgi:sec-independent protein translocase protein TatC